jgi:hypothetical protein
MQLHSHSKCMIYRSKVWRESIIFKRNLSSYFVLYFIPSVVKTDEIYFLKDPIIYKIDYSNLNFLFFRLYFQYSIPKDRIDKKIE